MWLFGSTPTIVCKKSSPWSSQRPCTRRGQKHLKHRQKQAPQSAGESNIFKVFWERWNYFQLINLKLDPWLTIWMITCVRKSLFLLIAIFTVQDKVYQNICNLQRPDLQINSSICFRNGEIKYICLWKWGEREQTPKIQTITTSNIVKLNSTSSIQTND